MKNLLYVHKKVAKGKTYYYFNLGLDDSGNRMLKRLPDIRSHKFGAAYAAAKGQRTKLESGGGVKDFDWLCRIYEKSPEYRRLAEASKQLYSRHLGYANASFRNKASRSAPLSVLTAQQVVELRDKYADRPGTANAILKALGALYAWAKRPGRGYVKDNIVDGVERLEGGEHEPWPLWLLEEALEDEAVRLPVALLYFLGQRIGDTVKLGPQNMVRGIVQLTQQKTGKSLKIAMHSRLAEIIEADAPKGAMVFLMSERGRPFSEPALRARLQKWAAARGQKIVPHGLRKNAVNALLEAGCSAAEVSSITGQTMQTIEHYGKQRDSEHLSRSAVIKFEARNKDATCKPELKTA
jgi:integrase